jgi:fucose 4-O-acetylase-like acetyltransferase
MTIAYGMCVAVTTLSALISAYYSVAAVRAASASSKEIALYTCAGSTSLLIVAVIAFVYQSMEYLSAVALAMILVQLFDMCIGIRSRDRMKTFGPAVVAALNVAALLYVRW